MDGSTSYPDPSKIDSSRHEHRRAYLFSVATCNGSFNCPVFDSTLASSTEIVCANFERMDKLEVTESSFQYHLETSIWKGFFSHLGHAAPECPWTVDDFHDDVQSFSDTYRQWRIHHALPVPEDSATQETDLDSDEAGEDSELRRENSVLKRENEDLRRAMAQGSDMLVPAPEDPSVLRETALRLVGEDVPCDFATVAKYISFMPSKTHLSCKGLYGSTRFMIRGFDGKTAAEAKLVLQGYLMAHEHRFFLDGPIEFKFVSKSSATMT
ncbi:hypothetical protein BFJ72_g2687 [Fusarium proliferatum]|uniref:Uncharacterized protein n=1 Tax=Gibberella intermedia TaxID=948311 RepID=A0A420TZK3_GIBIN|nr:hypothetical protein BFJ72_g2687 [Fusarium proliferatum]